MGVFSGDDGTRACGRGGECGLGTTWVYFQEVMVPGCVGGGENVACE